MSEAPGGPAQPGPGAGKARWRRWARAARRGVDHARLDPAVRAALAEWLAARPTTVVLTYAASAEEIDLGGLAGLADRHRFALTRTPAQGPLTVHALGSALERHPFGFDQPVETAPSIPLGEIGVVLAPGLVFDRAGGRIGYGMGYYDRLLARLPNARRVGVTVERLVVPRLPTDDHDVRMTHLATERGVTATDG